MKYEMAGNVCIVWNVYEYEIMKCVCNMKCGCNMWYEMAGNVCIVWNLCVICNVCNMKYQMAGNVCKVWNVCVIWNMKCAWNMKYEMSGVGEAEMGCIRQAIVEDRSKRLQIQKLAGIKPYSAHGY